MGKNNALGFVAAIVLACCVAVFAVSLIPGTEKLSYFASMVLSWAYLAVLASFYASFEARDRATGVSALLFGLLYAVFINLTYFTQLSTVNSKGAGAEVLQALRYAPGSWLFNLDIFGYALMALSTIFLGLSVRPVSSGEKAMRILMLIHGVFFPVCVAMPMLNAFRPAQGSPGSGGLDFAVLALEGWSAFFIPIMILAALYFRRRGLREVRA